MKSLFYVIKRICSLIIISITAVLVLVYDDSAIFRFIYLLLLLTIELGWLVYLLKYPYDGLSLNRIEVVNQLFMITLVITGLLKFKYEFGNHYDYYGNGFHITDSILLLPIGHIVIAIHTLTLVVFYKKQGKRRVGRFGKSNRETRMNMDGGSFDRFLLQTLTEKY